MDRLPASPSHGQQSEPPPTDRLFTGQIRDALDPTNLLSDPVNDWFSFFHSRYSDAQIGQFHTPASVVPNAKNPQALNRYAYALNNPLRLVDPSGHDPLDPSQMDPTWAAQFAHHHKGVQPKLQDWEDYQFSLGHPGSGPNGAWTSFDWQSYHYVRSYLTPALLGEIGHPADHAKDLAEIGDAAVRQYASGVPWNDGPDGTRIYLGGYVPPGESAWTFGNDIIIGKGTIARVAQGQISLSEYRALIAHEYTHVLQYRLLVAGFFGEYVASGMAGAILSRNVGNFGSAVNVLERPAYAVQDVYTHDPDLALPWEFWT
jgi:RHS repeat-associated protein